MKQKKTAVEPIRTRIFRENESLSSFIRAHVKKIAEGSVLVVASKIVALSEGRTALGKAPPMHLTMTDGMMMANAGIDESNADGKLVLLPKDSYASAARLRKELKKIYKIKKLGS